MHPDILYHYTNYNGASGIKKCGYIRKSRQWANFPPGVYMTLMDPEYHSHDDILINNYGRNYAQRAHGKLVDRADWVVKIYTDELDSSKLKKIGNNRSMYMYDDLVYVRAGQVMMNSNDADYSDYEYEYDDYDDDWKYRNVNSVSNRNFYSTRNFNDGNDSDYEYYGRSKSYYGKGSNVRTPYDRKAKTFNTIVVKTPTVTTVGNNSSTTMSPTATKIEGIDAFLRSITTVKNCNNTTAMVSPAMTKVQSSDGATTAFRNCTTTVKGPSTSMISSHPAATVAKASNDDYLKIPVFYDYNDIRKYGDGRYAKVDANPYMHGNKSSDGIEIASLALKTVLSSSAASKVKSSSDYDDIVQSYESCDDTFDSEFARSPRKNEKSFKNFVGRLGRRIRNFGKNIKKSFKNLGSRRA